MVARFTRTYAHSICCSYTQLNVALSCFADQGPRVVQNFLVESLSLNLKSVISPRDLIEDIFPCIYKLHAALM